MEIFSREGSLGLERGEVLKLMEKTYYLQHKMINVNPAPALETTMAVFVLPKEHVHSF